MFTFTWSSQSSTFAENPPFAVESTITSGNSISPFLPSSRNKVSRMFMSSA